MVNAFDNVPRAFVHLFVLMTTENFPDFIEAAWAANRATYAYFFVFVYLGRFFLTALFLALTVSFYLEYTEKQVTSERKKEWKGLLKAFNMIDTKCLNFCHFIAADPAQVSGTSHSTSGVH
jgi:hypothetical protein